MTRGRRELRFDQLTHVVPDVQQLLSQGYRTVGRWTLGQICRHLAVSIDCSIDGFPERLAPWIVRSSIGALVRHLMFITGRIKEGVTVPAKYIPPANVDTQREVEALSQAIARFATANDPLAMHPLVGAMTRSQ